jgi:hypothetical protein
LIEVSKRKDFEAESYTWNRVGICFKNYLGADDRVLREYPETEFSPALRVY